jgi:hypothetical protein
MTIRLSYLGTPEEELPCYKCGQPVPKMNSVIHFEWRLRPLGIEWLQTDCHLLPVCGEHPCIGSPSRFQYFPGYPKDERAEFSYDQESEGPYREALAKFQATVLEEMTENLTKKLTAELGEKM